MSKLISLDYLDDYNITELENAIKSGLERLNLSTFFKPQMKVLLKINLPNATSPDKAESTHPNIVHALVNYLASVGVYCVVADSPYGKYTIENLNDAYLNSGMLEVANLTTCELNHNLKTTTISIPNGVMTKSLTLLDVINDVDAIINIGKLKISDDLGYLGATSNLFGLVPGDMKSLVLNRCNTLKEFNNYIIDIAEALKDKIALNIIDGIVALEAGKTQRMLNCLAMSSNAYTIDSMMMDILGIKHENTLLKQAEERDVFESKKAYRVIGEKSEKFKIEDFSLIDFDSFHELHGNKKVHQAYFKTTQERVVIDSKKCKGCTRCSKICPTNAIMMKYDKNGELFAEIDYKKCIFCYKCITACPYFVADKKTPFRYRKLMKEINKHNNEN